MGAFWDAWNKQGQVNQQQALGQLQQVRGLAGLMQEARAMQDQQAVRGLLSDPTMTEDKLIPALVRLGPGGIDMANKIAVIKQHEAQAGLLGRRNRVDTRLQDQAMWSDPDKLAPIAGEAILSGHAGGAAILNYANQLREQAAMRKFLESRGAPPAAPVAPPVEATPQHAPPALVPQSAPPMLNQGSLRRVTDARAAVGQPPVGPVEAPSNDPFTGKGTEADLQRVNAKLADPNLRPAERAAYEDAKQVIIADLGSAPRSGATQTVNAMPAERPASSYTRQELEAMTLNPSKQIRDLGKRLLAEKIAQDKMLAKPPAEGTWVKGTDSKGDYYYNNKTGETRRIKVDGAPVQSPPNDPEAQRNVAAARAGGKVVGAAVENASLSLPKIEDAANYMMSLLDGVKNDPAKKFSIGYAANIPLSGIKGSPQARFETRLKQLEGKQFLEAYETLKGGGQITEIEGQKATQALSRINKSLNVKEFDEAVEEFRDIVKQSLERTRKLATRSPGNQTGGNSSTGQSLIERLGRY